MLDLFTIFSKGGIVLWCFQGTVEVFAPSVNALIRSILLQERSGSNTFENNGLTLKYKLDNEFELVFVVAYQKILQLAYIDKFLSDIHLEFRDKYKEDLIHQRFFQDFDFAATYRVVLSTAEDWGRLQAKVPRQMRTFEASEKSKKTVASMIERKGDDKENKKPGKNKKKGVGNGEGSLNVKEPRNVSATPPEVPEEELDEETFRLNKLLKMQKMAGKGKKADKKKSAQGKRGKEARVWDLGGSTRDRKSLDFSAESGVNGERQEYVPDSGMVGQMKGDIQCMEAVESEDEDEEEESRPANTTAPKSKGVFSMFKNLVGSKTITAEDVAPALDKLRYHLIAKNVASDIAFKLCESVARKLEGRVLGTFEGVASTVKATLTDALVQILSPKRRIDILRDIMETQKNNRPYVMAFCGVNGVGKSTNLAKICFWLIENNFRVLIAACDTFRAGAVEQLRTHTRHLNALHPPERHAGQQMVQLYEKGYGKDAAGIAMEAVGWAREARSDVVLIDTAGRMQDNEPLMRSLSKLIRVNDPDLVLFVGEALVGNEAVDQLVKFNQALADFSSTATPHLIDGIVLTKFDTIDDQVGAAISMTYITGQPIVFVGTGQTYTDLRNLNARAIVYSLMK